MSDTVLVYIGPFGFSGSTLMDAALAQAREAVTLGEAFQTGDWLRHDRLCTCREPMSRCPFWTPLLAGREARALSRPAGLGNRHDYLPAPAPRTPEVMAYAREAWSLIDAAAAQAEAGFVIDSSKHLWRLRALAALHPERMRFLHLVRDCAVVARSAASSKASPAAGEGARTEAVPYPRTVAKWIATNAASAAFCRRAGVARRRVDYAAFTAEPERELRAICAWLGIDYAPAMLRPSMEGLHNVAGSRWRMTRREVEIRPGDREVLPSWERAVSALSARLAGGRA